MPSHPENSAPRRVRHIDIARRAGVSRTTVSYVLSGRADVTISEAVRHRVLSAATELSYRPNDLARSLASGKTQTIGVLIPVLETTFLAELLNGLQRVCLEHAYRILLGYSRDDPRTEQEQLGLLLQHQVDGVVYVAGGRTPADLDRWLPHVLKKEPRPFVLVNHRPGRRLKVDYLISDDRYGAVSAVNHLIGLGHRSIAHISTGAHNSSALDCAEGYRQALEAAGIAFREHWVRGESLSPGGGAAAMSALLDSPSPPTAVFCGSDLVAAGALQVMRNRGLQAPRDVAMVSLGDTSFAQFLGLSTVFRSPGELGKQAGLRLLERIRNPHLPAEGVILPTHLIVRESSAGADVAVEEAVTARLAVVERELGAAGETVRSGQRPPGDGRRAADNAWSEASAPAHRPGGSRERFFKTIRHERPDRVPLDLWARGEVIQQLRRYLETDDEAAALGVDFAPWVPILENFPDFNRRAEAPRGGFWPGAWRRYVWHDDRTFEDAWGVTYRVGRDGKLVEWIDGPLAKAESLHEYDCPTPNMLAPPEEVADTVALLKASDRVVTTGIWMPFKRAWHLRGMENLLCDMLQNIDFVDALFEKLYAFETERAVRAAQAGVDVVRVVGDIAMEDRLFYSPELFRRLDVPRLREMIRRTRAAKPDVVMFYHSDGDVSAAMDDLIEAGFDIINPIQPECMNPYEVKERWGRQVTLWGTIGVRNELPKGTPESIRALVHERIRRCGYDGGFVLAPANAISYDTPPKNVVAMFEAAREFTWDD